MIQIRQLSKIYEGKNVKTVALKDINLTVEQGEFLMIQGQSGSGKTTLLNIIGLMDKATEGHYLYQGKDITQFSDKEIARFRNKEIGYIFQSFHLISTMNAIDNVEVPLGYRGVGHKERRELSKHRLIEVGLEDKLRHLPSQLSGGEQQRVAIARALVGEPNLILADEPTGNLDSATSKEIMQLLTKIHRQGKTIIMITHNNELLRYATRTVYIKDGQL